MTELVWLIEGYDGAKKLFERIIPASQISNRKMVLLLEKLASRHLDVDELIATSRRKNSRKYSPLTEVRRDRSFQKPVFMTVNSGHHFTARLKDPLDA